MPILRLACLSLTIVLFLSPAHAKSLNDTGQLRCFDETDSSTGTVSGATPAPEEPGFEAQDCSLGASAADAVGAQVKIGGSSVSGRDYTKIANDGSELPDTATLGPNPGDWRCTRDNVTGLTWLLRLNDGTLGDQDHRYAYGSNTPDEPDTCEGTASPCNTDPVVQQANTEQFCGGQDWVIPTPAQFESLFAYHDPAGSDNLIDRSWFPDQSNDGNLFVFWTQSPQDTLDPPSYWVADFGSGSMSFSGAESAAYLRLVRQAPAPVSPRFSTSEPTAGEVVVEDAETGLMWKQCPQGLSGTDCATGTVSVLDWSGALMAADTEIFANFTDWRLPNIIELASIRDYTPVAFGEVTLPGEFAGSAYTDTYWSATNDPRLTWLDLALTYQYSDSTAQNSRFKTEFLAVRLVRAGNFLGAHEPGNDTTPDAFSFTAKDAPPDTLVESNEAITIAGITGVTSLKVTGAAQSAFSINGGSWSSGVGAVRNGDTVRLRHQTAATNENTATTTLNIGGVTADFTSIAIARPTIAFQGTPRVEYPMNHNSAFPNILANPDFKLVVDHEDSAPEDLTVTVTSSNSTLLPPLSVDTTSDGVLVARFSTDTPDIWRASIRPARDQFGDSTLTFTVTDADGLTDSVEVAVSVLEGNRIPFATYSANTIRLPENATSGTYVVPGLLTSASPGEGEEQAQTVAHEFFVRRGYVPEDITAKVEPSFDLETGDFQFSFPEDLGVTEHMIISTWLVDTGTGDPSRCTGDRARGWAWSGQSELSQGPCESSRRIGVAPHGSIVLGLGVEQRGADEVVTQRNLATGEFQVAYTVRVENVGAVSIEGATVTVPAPRHLGSPSWTCTTTLGSCSVDSGIGAVETVVDLELDEVAEIVITGTLSDTTTHVSMAPTVTFAEGVEGTVLGNGVTRVNPVSNAYLFLNAFERVMFF